jgi:Domain of unknown function (DUF4136)
MLDGTAELARAMFGMGAVFVLASCATTPEVTSDFDRSANFATYHTFAVMQRERPAIPSALVATRTEDDIRQELQRKGYTLAADPASADFTVDFTIGAQERIRINSYPATYAGPWVPGAASWGTSYWGSNVDVRQYREGTLAVDVFDGRTHRPVWHGRAQKNLTRKDLEKPAEPISEAVSSVLAKFPPA